MWIWKTPRTAPCNFITFQSYMFGIFTKRKSLQTIRKWPHACTIAWNRFFFKIFFATKSTNKCLRVLELLTNSREIFACGMELISSKSICKYLCCCCGCCCHHCSCFSSASVMFPIRREFRSILFAHLFTQAKIAGIQLILTYLHSEFSILH